MVPIKKKILKKGDLDTKKHLSNSPTVPGLLRYDRETFHFTSIQPGSHSFFLGSVCSPNI